MRGPPGISVLHVHCSLPTYGWFRMPRSVSPASSSNGDLSELSELEEEDRSLPLPWPLYYAMAGFPHHAALQTWRPLQTPTWYSERTSALLLSSATRSSGSFAGSSKLHGAHPQAEPKIHFCIGGGMGPHPTRDPTEQLNFQQWFQEYEQPQRLALPERMDPFEPGDAPAETTSTSAGDELPRGSDPPPQRRG